MPSFTMVLANCRQQVSAEAQHEWKSFDLAVVDRWREHAFVDGAWQAIERASSRVSDKALEPTGLIEWVLEQARLQKRLVDEVIPLSGPLEKRAIAAAEKEWRATRGKRGGISAGAKRDLALHHRENRIRLLGRQPNPRKRFILLCREMFIANCGQPLDDVTEMLVFVVFGVAAGSNEVRDALKPSTRLGRTPKPKNSR
ncbi:hypothetical protein Q3C01_01055 [Bradyrhizobium sp. UFLA05-109]